MLLHSLKVQDYGPIAQLALNFTETVDRVHPVILVGGNGSGKTLIISQIINALISAKQLAFSDAEVEKGRSYRFRSPLYIRSGSSYYFCETVFDSELKFTEMQLSNNKLEFEERYNYCPVTKVWAKMGGGDGSILDSNFNENLPLIKSLFGTNCLKFFPANRFEEPAWLNEESLTFRVNFQRTERIEGRSQRRLFEVSPLADNANWLLKVIRDRQTFEMKVLPDQVRAHLRSLGAADHAVVFAGRSNTILNAINSFLKSVFPSCSNPQIKIGDRFNDLIGIYDNETQIIPNIFQLSSGEMQLLNMFLSIIRDYDYAGSSFSSLNDVRGLVLIDEADLNLHSNMQIGGIAKIIELLPKVQFILSTHSPLMVIGVSERIGEDKIQIIELPSGEKLTASDFAEVKNSYEAYKRTIIHRKEIRNEIIKSHKPILYVEGVTDEKYIESAAKALGRSEIIENIEIKNVGGFRNLDRIWKSIDNNLIDNILNRKLMLLYDCDTNKNLKKSNLCTQYVLQRVESNPIESGIENLFSVTTIQKARAARPSFFDVTPAFTREIRGEKVHVPENISVNENEKANLCEWICLNADGDDFNEFSRIFDAIEENLIL